MRVQFDWDEANRNHVAEHGVRPEEAEQVLLNSPVDVESQLHGGETRNVVIGETSRGRVLIVVTTWRNEKLRIVTAFPASRKARRQYEQQKKARESKRTQSP